MIRALALVLLTVTANAQSVLQPGLEYVATAGTVVYVHATDLTPNGRYAVLGGAGIGGEYLVAPTCNGTWVDLIGPIELIGDQAFTADENGTAFHSISVGGDPSGTAIQIIDLETCEVTDVSEI